jgi:hypothetical protein
VLVAASSVHAVGESRYWQGSNSCGSNEWDSSCWSGLNGNRNVPAPGDDIYAYKNWNSGLSSIIYRGPEQPSAAYANIFIESWADPDWTLVHASGYLASGTQVVGHTQGYGSIHQQGGTNAVSGSLTIGQNYLATGTYRMDDGVLTAGDITVGHGGAGSFVQGSDDAPSGAPAVTVAETLSLGKAFNNYYPSSYTLLRGTLTAKNEIVGNDRAATFTQKGGVNTVAETLTIGTTLAASQYFSGTRYRLEQGELHAKNIVIGDGSIATLEQSGGTVEVAETLSVGSRDWAVLSYRQPSSYVLSDGELTTQKTVVGQNGAIGEFVQTGGVHNTNELELGNGAGSEGTYNLGDGELNVKGNIVNGAGQGSLLISGGALNFGAGNHDVDVDTLHIEGDGSINLTDGAAATFQKDVLHNGDAIDLAGGTNATFNGAYGGAGLFTGAGTATFNSVLNVGDGPITFSVAGNMVLGEHSKSIMQIGTAGYDKVDVGGSLSLDGELNLVGLNGFTGKLGDVFDLYQAETILGQFDLLTLLTLGEGLSWKIEYLIDAIGTKDIVRLSVVNSVPLPASVWLLQSALFGLLAMRRYSRKNR